MKYKINLISFLLISLPLCSFAQKISLGSCVTRDGGQYKGEMVGNKPNGKGTTVFKNGDTYEGSYVKGKRNGYGIYTFADGENMKVSGWKISSMDVELTISRIIINM